MSPARMSRYLQATGFDTRKAMTLYRKNLKLSQEMFTLISCFEIALRNKINDQYMEQHGKDWLQDSVSHNGFFNTEKCKRTKSIVVKLLNSRDINSHTKLLASLDFGFWRYLFAQPQFYAGGQCLLKVFPLKPRSSASIQFNQSFIFNKLKSINDLRNRIAHHEPICFKPFLPMICTKNSVEHYNLIIELFRWMDIDESGFLYGLDHVLSLCDEINNYRL